MMNFNNLHKIAKGIYNLAYFMILVYKINKKRPEPGFASRTGTRGLLDINRQLLRTINSEEIINTDISASRVIIQAHGSHLQLIQCKEQGTCFEIRLPQEVKNGNQDSNC